MGVAEATTQEFDLVVVTEMNDGYPGLEGVFDHLNLKGTPRLYWDFDVSYHPERSYKRASAIEYDGYLVGNRLFCGPDDFGRLKKPILHLPYACSPRIHKRKEEITRHYLLGFIGSMTDERKRVIELAQKTLFNSAHIHHAEGIFGDALVDTTNSYCAVLHRNQNACRGLVPGRPWETTACGTTLLMDRVSYIDFVEFLPEHLHEDLFVYDTDDDLREWIHKWQEKWAILQLGNSGLMSYVHKNHSYKNRAERIIEWVREHSIITA